MYSGNRKEWIFTFEGGGWNSVWAETREEAIQKAIEEYEYSDTLNPKADSFWRRDLHEDRYDNLLRLFW